jgi:hypothetical protein
MNQLSPMQTPRLSPVPQPSWPLQGDTPRHPQPGPPEPTGLTRRPSSAFLGAAAARSQPRRGIDNDRAGGSTFAGGDIFAAAPAGPSAAWGDPVAFPAAAAFLAGAALLDPGGAWVARRRFSEIFPSKIRGRESPP